MSTVTLSKPHCAITSAEKPEGIASQAFTATLPAAHISLTLFAIMFPFLGSNSPSITVRLLRGPLYACFTHADFARGVYNCSPGIVRQGYAVFGTIGAHLCFRLARDQDGIDAGSRLGFLEVADIARNLAVEEVGGVDHFGIDIHREHAVGEAPVWPGRPGAGQRATEQFADQRQTRSLVFAERADRALALAVVTRPLDFIRSVQHRRILAQIAVEIDQRALWQFLAAAACDQHLAFRDDRGREIQHHRSLPLARDAD